jgi:hypothetical protein
VFTLGVRNPHAAALDTKYTVGAISGFWKVRWSSTGMGGERSSEDAPCGVPHRGVPQGRGRRGSSHVMRACPAQVLLQALARLNGQGDPGSSPSRPVTTGLRTTPSADWRHHRLPAPTPGP